MFKKKLFLQLTLNNLIHFPVKYFRYFQNPCWALTEPFSFNWSELEKIGKIRNNNVLYQSFYFMVTSLTKTYNFKLSHKLTLNFQKVAFTITQLKSHFPVKYFMYFQNLHWSLNRQFSTQIWLQGGISNCSIFFCLQFFFVFCNKATSHVVPINVTSVLDFY